MLSLDGGASARKSVTLLSTHHLRAPLFGRGERRPSRFWREELGYAATAARPPLPPPPPPPTDRSNRHHQRLLVIGSRRLVRFRGDDARGPDRRRVQQRGRPLSECLQGTVALRRVQEGPQRAGHQVQESGLALGEVRDCHVRHREPDGVATDHQGEVAPL